MEILKFYFEIFKKLFNVLDKDFFGLGFSYLSLILSVLLIIVLIRFLTNNTMTLSNSFSLRGSFKDYSHSKREMQIRKERSETLEDDILKGMKKGG